MYLGRLYTACALCVVDDHVDLDQFDGSFDMMKDGLKDLVRQCVDDDQCSQEVEGFVDMLTDDGTQAPYRF